MENHNNITIINNTGDNTPHPKKEKDWNKTLIGIIAVPLIAGVFLIISKWMDISDTAKTECDIYRNELSILEKKLDRIKNSKMDRNNNTFLADSILTNAQILDLKSKISLECE